MRRLVGWLALAVAVGLVLVIAYLTRYVPLGTQESPYTVTGQLVWDRWTHRLCVATSDGIACPARRAAHTASQ